MNIIFDLEYYDNFEIDYYNNVILGGLKTKTIHVLCLDKIIAIVEETYIKKETKEEIVLFRIDMDGRQYYVSQKSYKKILDEIEAIRQKEAIFFQPVHFCA